MKIAVMQPYFFPYIAYFQLAGLVDKFIFYDDVNFIKNGWINRNRILINGEARYMTVHLKNASSFKLTNEVEFLDNRDKLLKTLDLTYKKAPFFKEVFPLLENCLSFRTNKISELSKATIIKTCEFLGLNTIFESSSESYSETRGLEKSQRLQQICLLNNATEYYNLIGGVKLYDKHEFKKYNIDLYYLKVNEITYKQFNNEFVPWLSIIDLLMFNSKDATSSLLRKYLII